MSTSLNLRQSIEREMEEEARVEKKVEAFKRRFLKQKSNRAYKIVLTIEESDIIIVLKKKDSTHFLLAVNTGNKSPITETESAHHVLIF